MNKRILSLCTMGICFLSGMSVAFAYTGADGTDQVGPPVPTAADTPSSTNEGWTTTVTVTEKIPGMDCVWTDVGDITKQKYKCTVQAGFGSVMLIFKGLIKYATFITALVGALMLVYSGIEYSMSGASWGDVKAAKGRITKILAGLTLLFLIGFVLNSVAPWIYR